MSEQQQESIGELLTNTSKLVVALNTHVAVMAGLTAALVENTAASNAVAHSHAELIAALLSVDKADAAAEAPPAPIDGIFDADGNQVA